ncbi:uncharacterized protein si:ch211-57n23.1 [Erpetoichthys calabaricus]|uniref:uncharacterized protein si:ch211-57n23.1 n=1 Tax=Erpetoichthys calabaricus TaxID=27687 RepID=UPI0010A03FB1|nr:uncharacterized protein si:ch211-57n23.1 [Erpetoichthys calabaricus]
MTQGSWLMYCLLLMTHKVAVSEVLYSIADMDWDWGSGLHELLHNFPADSPFVSAGSQVNCSQRFWLPSSSPICWENIAGPEDFEKSRLMVLQNRAALRALLVASGLGEEEISYERVAKLEIQGVRADHLKIMEMAETMQQVFQGLEKQQMESKELWAIGSLKDQITATKHSIEGRDHLAASLERKLAELEGSLRTLQLRLAKILTG